MATFKATILKNNRKEDKTWNVVIRFSHANKNRYIATTMFVEKKDMTASFKIKNRLILDKCEELIRRYREKVYSLNLETNDMDIDDIVSILKEKKTAESISFSAYFEKWRSNAAIKGIKNYSSAVNSYKRFLNRENITMDDVSVRNLKGFETFLKDRPRAASLYTNCIVKIFRDARDHYNDEDNDIIRIKHSLSKYHAPRQNVAEKRALTVDVIRKIFALPYDGIVSRNRTSRHDLALDCFRLSFCLMGMNSADLYNAEEYKDGCIRYFRTKTRDRRSDKAEMVVRVHPAIRPVFDKYRDAAGERVFNFYKRFSSMTDFNRSVNIGLKEVGDEVGVECLQFYSARHSMATIAVNEAGISKWTVNDMLCHTYRAMQVTDLYIKKDFSPVNDANFKLLDYVLT